MNKMSGSFYVLNNIPRKLTEVSEFSRIYTFWVLNSVRLRLRNCKRTLGSGLNIIWPLDY